MAALQFVEIPDYAALLFRKTYRDLSLPGALMDRAHDWLAPTAAHWNETDKRWTFPSGATMTFGYLDAENDKYRYQGAEAQFVGFDELTQLKESQYLYLFSRNRRVRDSDVPLLMRSTSNPGGVGHDWVKARFIEPHEDGERVFVPARLADNPYLDSEQYLESLDQLDAVTRAQLLEGNWDVLPDGEMFKREWFADLLTERPAFLTSWVRYWDKAATAGGGDWTAGVLIGKAGAMFYVLDAVRGQWSPAARAAVIRQTTALDAQLCPRYSVWVEQEPGSGGKESALATITDLAGYDVHAEPVTGSKVVRAQPFAAQCEAGNVKLIAGAWNAAYLNELCAFPAGPHDDQVDASAGAFAKLAAVQHKSGAVKYA